MRELDLLLEKFLCSDLDTLNDPELEELAALLREPDQDILAWLTAAREPPEALHAIVRRIRRSLI